MHFSRNRIKLYAGILFLSFIFIFLRLKTLNHLLMWDEAWNILSLRAFLYNAIGDPFYWNYHFHPPLYMFFAQLLAPFKEGVNVRLEFLSLVFSYITFLIMYLFSARIGGWRYAWLSGLSLALMPASIGYDTWIKRDGLASLFGYLALFLLFKRKYFWCSVILALSLLSKESALFFILAATFLIFIFKEKHVLKKIFTMYIVIFIATSWWFLYFSRMTDMVGEAKKTIFDYYLLTGEYTNWWINPPYYYLEKLLPDLGIGLLLFLIIGICYIVFLTFFKKQFRWAIPLVVALCVYIPISIFFKAKNPWVFLSARPALAMIAGSGALYLLRKSKRVKLLFPAFFLLLVLTVFTGISFSYSKYHIKTYPNGWPGARCSRDLALYLNNHMQNGDRLMITEFAYWKMPLCPIFTYYWKMYPISVIKGNEEVKEIMQDIIKHRISWLVVVDSPDPKFNFHRLVKDIKKSPLGNPEVVGWSYVWKTKRLWSDNEQGSEAEVY